MVGKSSVQTAHLFTACAFIYCWFRPWPAWSVLSDLHNKYVFVPADKAPNNIIIICKRYYIETLIKELGLDNSSTTTGNSTYTPCQMSSEDIVNTHDTFMKSFGIELSDDDKRLPYLYWTPKLHKSPVKHRFIAGSSLLLVPVNVLQNSCPAC